MMNLDNMAYRVANAPLYDRDTNEYRKQSIGPLVLVALVGIIPGIVLKSYWLYLSIALLAIAISCVFCTYRMTVRELSVERSLILDVVISGSWYLVLSILGFMYLTIWKGFDFGMFLVCLPPVSILLFLGRKIHKVTMNASEFNPIKKSSNFHFGGIGFGIIGANLAAIISANVDQDGVYIIVLLGLSIWNCIMSLGLLSAQQLYYLKKYNLCERIDRIIKGE